MHHRYWIRPGGQAAAMQVFAIQIAYLIARISAQKSGNTLFTTI
jgi:hypothetical protein